MDSLHGSWIWFYTRSGFDNTVACFAHPFVIQRPRRSEKSFLRISAETRYVVSMNGREVGRGPLRAWPGVKFYDTYDITSLLTPGENLLAVRVWDMGFSTFQSVSARGGLIFDIVHDGEVLAASGPQTRARPELGHQFDCLWRSPSLGPMEHYIADRSVIYWDEIASASEGWDSAVVLPDQWGPLWERPLPAFSVTEVRPRRLISRRLVGPSCQQVSIHLGAVLFPGRRDLDLPPFEGFVGCVLRSPAQEGIISFSHSGGIAGDFRIGSRIYPLGPSSREVPVALEEGEQLLLMRYSGSFDEPFCHLEFHFPWEVEFVQDIGLPAGFFAIGPTRVFAVVSEQHSPEYDAFFAFSSLEELRETGIPLLPVPPGQVHHNLNLGALLRSQVVWKEFPVHREDCELLHGSSSSTRLELPSLGRCHQLIVDFGEINAGALSFTVRSEEGTILNLCGVDELKDGEPVPAPDVNNAVRYVCRKGTQSFTTMTRMGLRYLVITVCGQSGTVDIETVSLLRSGYPDSGMGLFRCNDERLVRVWEESRRAHLNIMEDVFTYGPLEQTLRTENLLVAARTNMWVSRDLPIYFHSLITGGNGVSEFGLLPDFGPTDRSVSTPLANMAWIAAVSYYWIASGERKATGATYPVMDTVMRTLLGYVDAQGALLVPRRFPALPGDEESVDTGLQALLVACCRITADFAALLGRQEEEAFYRKSQKKLMHFIETVLWEEENSRYADGWSPENGLSATSDPGSLVFLADLELIPAHKERLLSQLADAPLTFTPFQLLHLWDNWPGDLNCLLEDILYRRDRTPGGSRALQSVPLSYLSRDLLGLIPVERGFRKLQVLPPVCRLEWCEGSIPTQYGAVFVRWERRGDRGGFYHVTAPKEVEILVPDQPLWEIVVTFLD